MRLQVRFVLYIGLASLVPLALAGLGATELSSAALLSRVAAMQGGAADAVAVQVDTWVGLHLRILEQQARAVPALELSPAARERWVDLLLRQSPELLAVGLQDATGAWATAPVGPADALVVALRSAVPRGAGLGPPTPGTSLTLGPVLDGAAGRILPVSIALDGGGALIAGVDLRGLSDGVRARSGADLGVEVLDDRGQRVLGDDSGWVDPAALRALLGGAAATDVRYRLPGGQEVVAACAPLPELGWTVVVAEPVATSAALVRQIRLQTLYIGGVAALLAAVVGVLFARELAAPIHALREAALAVAEGAVGRQVEAPDQDEIGDLASAFNLMSRRLEGQRAEIEAFNRELQDRVDARTRELEAAQGQLVRAARQAAAGELGAGLAHELNNPLAAILGLAQLSLARPDLPGALRERLEGVQAQARRCREVLGQLQGLQGDAQPARAARLDLGELFVEVLTLLRGPLRQRGVEPVLGSFGQLPTFGDRGELARALAWVLQAARAAAPSGGELHASAEVRGHELRLRLRLLGPGLRVDSDDGRAGGVALYAARRSLEAAGGRLEEPEAPLADGALVWHVVLPEVQG
jgi:two-component system NtrC family sensor kinase